MSRASTEGFIRSFYDAFNRRDLEAMEAAVAPDVVVKETPGFNPSADSYQGREAVMRYWSGWFKFWDEVVTQVTSLRFVSDYLVVVTVRVTVRGRGSNLEFADDWGHVVEIRDGALVRAVLCRTPDEAAERAGQV